MKRVFWSLLVLGVLCAPASAHFIWIAPAEKDTVRIVFSDDTDPDTNVPVTKIAQTQLFLRDAAGDTALDFTLKKDHYTAPIKPGTTGMVSGTCLYGVVDKGDAPLLLNYYAKTLVGANSAELLQQASKPSAKLPLDVVLKRGKQGKLVGQLLWQGKSVAGCEIIVDVPGEKRFKGETDKEGWFDIAIPKVKGLILIRGRYVEDRAGTQGGKAYKQTKHYITMTCPAAIGQISGDAGAKAGGVRGSGKGQEDPAATKLLKNARAARAVWDQFPGFRANLSINHNGQVYKTEVEVADSGKVTLKVADPDVLKFVRGQLSSLVGHRLGGGPEKETPCAFFDKNESHPLGRKIKVLSDELHSSYRIKDDQIVEVNRQTKETRFTITVLKNYVTQEKKFLPAYYVVNTWKNDTNQLVSSMSHFHTWKRVGKFDLPEAMTLLIARGGAAPAADAVIAAAPLDVWTFTFTGHDLLPWKG